MEAFRRSCSTRKLQAAWRTFARKRQTTDALARAFVETGAVSPALKSALGDQVRACGGGLQVNRCVLVGGFAGVQVRACGECLRVSRCVLVRSVRTSRCVLMGSVCRCAQLLACASYAHEAPWVGSRVRILCS